MTYVLVADDDPDIRELVVFKLENSGLRVCAAGNGRAALDAALANPPDLAVLDVMMPGLTGLEVCAQLRANAATKDVPVVLLTAKALEADVTRGFEIGADDYVTKPFSPRELLSRVQAVLTRQRR
jgi:DNA-binding response OmpR family regulator